MQDGAESLAAAAASPEAGSPGSRMRRWFTFRTRLLLWCGVPLIYCVVLGGAATLDPACAAFVALCVGVAGAAAGSAAAAFAGIRKGSVPVLEVSRLTLSLANILASFLGATLVVYAAVQHFSERLVDAEAAGGAAGTAGGGAVRLLDALLQPPAAGAAAAAAPAATPARTLARAALYGGALLALALASSFATDALRDEVERLRIFEYRKRRRGV